MMYMMHGMPHGASQDRSIPRAARLRPQLEAMRRRGMSATAIRRALGLSATEAVGAGLIAPRMAPRVVSETLPGVVPVPGAGRGPAMNAILQAVARAAGVAAESLRGPGQARALVRPRQLTMHLVRGLCLGASLPAIGHFLRRDHTTVLYGCRRAAALLARDAGYRALRDRALALLDEARYEQG